MKAQNVLALGASHLFVAQFSLSGGSGLVLERALSLPLDSDPSKRGTWLSAVGNALDEIKVRFPLKGVWGLALPEWVVLTKRLRVARIEGEGQEEVARFEAVQAFPNGLEGCHWAYAVLREDKVERDVLAHVAELKFLHDLLDLLWAIGIQPRVIDAFVSAHLNAYAYNYAGETERTLLLDMGARSVSLCLVGGSEPPFLRNLSFGGSQVTQAIVSELGLSFAEAEKLKLKWFDNPAPDQARLNRVAAGFTKRLLNEAQRSLALYRRQYGAGNPERVLLSGRASLLPGMAERLERKTGLPALRYDPFRNLPLGVGVDPAHGAKWAPILPSGVGVAASLVGASPIEINLLPHTHASRLALSEKMPWLKAAAGLVLGAGGLIGLTFQGQSWKLQREIALASRQVSSMEASAQDARAAYEKFKALQASDLSLDQLHSQRLWYVLFLGDLQGRLHQVRNVWLDSFSAVPDVSGNRQLRLTGSLLDRQNPLSAVSADSRRQVETLLTSFQGSPFIAEVGERRFDTSRPGILKFDVSLTLEPNMPL